MANVTNFFKKHKTFHCAEEYHSFYLSSEQLQLLQDLIDDKLKPEHAAKLLTKDIIIKKTCKAPLVSLLMAIVHLAIFPLNLAIQIKCVELASALRDLRKSLWDPRNKNLLWHILSEMYEHHGDIWNALWNCSHDLKGEEQHSFWISINKFSARLTKADVIDWSHEGILLCNSLVDDHKLRGNSSRWDRRLSDIAQELRKDPTLFAVALSAAAQHMIHAALNLYRRCKEDHPDPEYRWEDWKAVFKEFGTIENIEARNDAPAGVVAMDRAEELYNSRQTSEEGEMAMGRMPKLSERSGGVDGQNATEKM